MSIGQSRGGAAERDEQRLAVFIAQRARVRRKDQCGERRRHHGHRDRQRRDVALGLDGVAVAANLGRARFEVQARSAFIVGSLVVAQSSRVHGERSTRRTTSRTRASARLSLAFSSAPLMPPSATPTDWPTTPTPARATRWRSRSQRYGHSQPAEPRIMFRRRASEPRHGARPPGAGLVRLCGARRWAVRRDKRQGRGRLRDVGRRAAHTARRIPAQSLAKVARVAAAAHELGRAWRHRERPTGIDSAAKRAAYGARDRRMRLAPSVHDGHLDELTSVTAAAAAVVAERVRSSDDWIQRPGRPPARPATRGARHRRPWGGLHRRRPASSTSSTRTPWSRSASWSGFHSSSRWASIALSGAWP